MAQCKGWGIPTRCLVLLAAVQVAVKFADQAFLSRLGEVAFFIKQRKHTHRFLEEHILHKQKRLFSHKQLVKLPIFLPPFSLIFMSPNQQRLIVDKGYLGTVNAFTTVLLQLRLEDMLVEETLQLLVRHVDTKLLKSVNRAKAKMHPWMCVCMFSITCVILRAGRRGQRRTRH